MWIVSLSASVTDDVCVVNFRNMIAQIKGSDQIAVETQHKGGPSFVVGTVKFSGSVADLADETRHAELPWISIPTRHYQPRRLAVSPLRCELSRCRRSPGPTRHYGVLRSDPAVEAIRLWCLTFGSVYARRFKRRQGRLGDIWHLDEVFVTIQGQRRYLWRAVDQDGDVIDILVQSRRDCRAATRFFRKLLKGQERTPGRLVTDKLSSYRAAHRAVMPSVAHRTDRYENNRAEVSHQPTRQRERQMRRFQISRAGTTILVRAWTRPQPLPRWPSPGASGASSGATRTLFSHLGCSHDRRLTRTEITIPSTGSLDER